MVDGGCDPAHKLDGGEETPMGCGWAASGVDGEGGPDPVRTVKGA